MGTIAYLIKTFRGGVSDENNKGVSGSFKHGHGLDIHGRSDVLTGKQAMLTIFDSNNTTQTGIVQFFVPASDGSTYCFGSTGSIFCRSGDGAFNFVYNDPNGKITGAAEYGINSGGSISTYLFWATASSLARKVLQGADITPDSGAARWTDAEHDWKTTLDIEDWHTMMNAGGVLSIANGAHLATVDFEGTFNAIAMSVRPGNKIKSLEERDDFVLMGSGRSDGSEQGHIWAWITTAVNWIQKKRIPIKGVNALITTEVMIMQGGSDGELFFSDFVNAVPIHGIPGGGQVQPGGVAIEDDLAIFGFFGGDYPGIWSYGRKRKNRPFALNYAYRLAGTVNGSTISTVGAVAVVDGVLLASWGTTDESTSEYGIDSVSSTTKATALYESLEFDAGAPHLKKPFNTVKLILHPLASGTSVSVKYRRDNRTDINTDGWKYAITGASDTTFSTVDAVEAIFTIGEPANIYEIGVELNPSSNDSPKVRAITTYLGEESNDYA